MNKGLVMDGLVDIIVAIVIIGICFMEYKRSN